MMLMVMIAVQATTSTERRETNTEDGNNKACYNNDVTRNKFEVAPVVRLRFESDAYQGLWTIVYSFLFYLFIIIIIN